MEVLDISWKEVFRFVIENPEAQIAGRIRHWTDEDGHEWTGLNPTGEYGLRFTTVPALQGNKLWVPAGEENQVYNVDYLR